MDWRSPSSGRHLHLRGSDPGPLPDESQVYYHRLRRIYDLYLKEHFKARERRLRHAPEKALGHNDMTMITEIIRDADRSGAPFQPWAERIRNRRHHRLVYESDEDTGAIFLQKVGVAFQKIKTEYPEIDFQLDVANGLNAQAPGTGRRHGAHWAISSSG